MIRLFWRKWRLLLLFSLLLLLLPVWRLPIDSGKAAKPSLERGVSPQIDKEFHTRDLSTITPYSTLIGQVLRLDQKAIPFSARRSLAIYLPGNTVQRQSPPAKLIESPCRLARFALPNYYGIDWLQARRQAAAPFSAVPALLLGHLSVGPSHDSSLLTNWVHFRESSHLQAPPQDYRLLSHCSAYMVGLFLHSTALA